jgi:HAD superfamily hydrolase (TIGR01549 family)
MKAVIFDVDGTLVDSVDLHAKAWQKALDHFGHQVPFEDVRAQIGKGGDQLMPVFLSAIELRSQGEALERYRSELFKARYLGKVRGFPRVRDLFERLRLDKIKIALASSAKADELQTYKEIAGIADLLDAETTSNDAGKSKPHPDIFQAALQRLDLPAEDAVVVGDSPYDAEAASKAGLRSIGFLCGGFRRDDLLAAGFQELYEDAADLLAHYEHSLLGSGSELNARAHGG